MSLKKILPKGVTLRAAGVDVVQQTDVLLEALPSLAAFMGSNLVFKYVMREVLGITKFPHALVGMFVFFGGMCAMKPADADKVPDVWVVRVGRNGSPKDATLSPAFRNHAFQQSRHPLHPGGSPGANRWFL